MSKQSEQFGAWLRGQLQARGHALAVNDGSKTRFAAAAGLGATTVSRALAGERLPDTEGLVGIARALDLPVVKVLDGAGFVNAEEVPRVTVPAALDDWGITDPGDRALVADLVERLRRA